MSDMVGDLPQIAVPKVVVELVVSAGKQWVEQSETTIAPSARRRIVEIVESSVSCARLSMPLASAWAACSSGPTLI